MGSSVLETDARTAGPDCETVATTTSKRLMGDTGRMPLTKDAIKFGTFVVTSQVCSSLLDISWWYLSHYCRARRRNEH
jgi:hypothetical protein